ncbi:BaiN/RdsA family NAD(P)/FAD-dependent oxidoreductase [Moritella yayanosii]|uniref:Putative oxidoreductase with FAD/NAD(P)-binding domain n=1 Tax=Moritella yayanosii TaxID=69539 RepID=A0A330LU22_9GAMM|nr:NAD(P)/FAD-dependent oxidoreductase [Moritella yayanosii]SQD79318.1 putative oxidoreductase with FAD/NAD(P)-binding domain [Moritella yayanosii]
MSRRCDVIVIGAGAAGLMCAASASYRGRSVLVLDNAKKAGRKVLISGGGRCNFTNNGLSIDAFICANPHFVKSALSRYTAWNFIDMVERHGIAYHERDHGQLFCDDSAKDIVKMLHTECDWAGVKIQLRTEILSIEKAEDGRFHLQTSQGALNCESVVVATGGLSMPKLGATPYGYKIAEQFGLKVNATKAGLVPFTLQQHDKDKYAELSGVSLPARITTVSGVSFKEALLFTHRGLSGPSVLQVSSYWNAGEAITINLLPDTEITEILAGMTESSPNQALKTALARVLPKRLVEIFYADGLLPECTLKQLQHKDLHDISTLLHNWQVKPNGTEGYRTAEVTLGGVDTDELSSKTMEAKKVSGLYFIGEVMDVSGWLGGYNFQWAWSSGWSCGQFV